MERDEHVFRRTIVAWITRGAIVLLLLIVLSKVLAVYLHSNQDDVSVDGASASTSSQTTEHGPRPQRDRTG